MPTLNAGGYGYLEWVSRYGAHVGRLRVRSPRLHDNAQNIRAMLPTSVTYIGGDLPVQQPVFSGDTLIVESTGTAADVDTLALGMWFSDVQGVSADLHMPADIASITQNICTVEVAAVASATVGTWGSVLLTVNYNVLKAGMSYAILGYEMDTPQTAIAFHGSDSGNMKVGAPGITDYTATRTWFVDMSMATGRPHILVFQANNANAFNVDLMSSTASGTSNVTLYLAQLAQNI